MSSSQERLSEESLNEHIDLVRKSLYISDANYHLHCIISEIKRLQAIEAERDNFKLGLDSIGMVAFGELRSGSQNKAIDTICQLVHEFLKGVNDHDTTNH